ncbi:membrane protein YczE [Homoserinimonas sp. A520]
MSPALTMTRRIAQLFVGLLCYGLGIALMVRAQLGIAPWDVLTQGLQLKTGLAFGFLTILISIVVLFLWIPIRQKMGIGTIANALLIGVFVEVGFVWFPVPTNLVWSVLSFALGLVLVGFATGLYIGARFGPGPRDGLMTGLHRVTGWPIWVVRTGIEVAVLVIGWLLGGNVGVGTLAFALLIGPLAGFFMPILLVPAAVTREERDPAPER